jgi:hypothetical protein
MCFAGISPSYCYTLLLPLLLLLPLQTCCPQPLTPVMVLERNPDATAEEKAAAYEQLLQPEGPFKERLGLLDKWLVSGSNVYHYDSCMSVTAAS